MRIFEQFDCYKRKVAKAAVEPVPDIAEIGSDLKTLARHGKPSVLYLADLEGKVAAKQYIEFPCPEDGTLPPESCTVAVEQVVNKLYEYADQKDTNSSLYVFNQDNNGNVTSPTYKFTISSDGSGFVDFVNQNPVAPDAAAPTTAPAATQPANAPVAPGAAPPAAAAPTANGPPTAPTVAAPVFPVAAATAKVKAAAKVSKEAPAAPVAAATANAPAASANGGRANGNSHTTAPKKAPAVPEAVQSAGH